MLSYFCISAFLFSCYIASNQQNLKESLYNIGKLLWLDLVGFMETKEKAGRIEKPKPMAVKAKTSSALFMSKLISKRRIYRDLGIAISMQVK